MALLTTFEYENDPTIIMYSPVVIKPGMRPARVVLRKLREGKWVTHLETMGLEGNVFKHEAFHNGNYFEVVEYDSPTEEEFKRRAGAEYGEAVADYKERCRRL